MNSLLSHALDPAALEWLRMAGLGVATLAAGYLFLRPFFWLDGVLDRMLDPGWAPEDDNEGDDS